MHGSEPWFRHRPHCEPSLCVVPSDSVCHSCPTSRVQTQPPTCPVPHVPFTCQRVEALARSGGEAWLGCWAKLASSLRFSAYPTKLTNPAHRALLQSRQSGSHTQTTSHSTQRFCQAHPVCVDACTCRGRERRHFPKPASEQIPQHRGWPTSQLGSGTTRREHPSHRLWAQTSEADPLPPLMPFASSGCHLCV